MVLPASGSRPAYPPPAIGNRQSPNGSAKRRAACEKGRKSLDLDLYYGGLRLWVSNLFLAPVTDYLELFDVI